MQTETILHAPRLSGRRATATLRLDDPPFELYYEASAGAISADSDGFAIAALLPAMAIGRPLVVEAPISARLLAALPQAQALLSSWCDVFRPIEVRAESDMVPVSVAPGAGLCFSLGVDSFHTLREKRHELTHLVTVRGFDPVSLDDDVWAAIVRNAGRVAEREGKTLVVVDTNVRALPPRRRWRWMHGPALASAGHLLAPSLGTLYVSSSVTPGWEGPWGSHPALDPLWSSERLEVVHCGQECSRVAKMLAIADESLMVDTLRVCQASDGHEYNCGRCEKCVGVMLVMQAIGRLDRMATLPTRLDPRVVQQLRLHEGSRQKLFADTLDLLRARGGHAALVRALERALLAARLKRALIPVRDMARGLWRKTRG